MQKKGEKDFGFMINLLIRNLITFPVQCTLKTRENLNALHIPKLQENMYPVGL